MTFSIKKIDNFHSELNVNLDRQDLTKYVILAEKSLAGNLKVKGFRVGKAPQEAVRKKVGEERIREEALGLAVKSTLADVLNKEKIDVFEQEEFKILKNTRNELEYRTKFSIFPDIRLGKYTGLGIEKRNITVEEREVDLALKNIGREKAVFKETDGPAQKGDRAEVDFVIKNKDTVIEGGESKNHPVTIGDGLFVPGFEDQLIGMKKGETKCFSLEIPADFYQKSIAGKKLDFEVGLKKVENVTIPEIDDGFAKRLGQFESLAVLKTSIRQGIVMEKEMSEKNRVQKIIVGKISEDSDIPVPGFLLERQLDQMMQNLDSRLHQTGMELGLYLARLGKTQDQLREEWKREATEQTKNGLIIRAIAQKEQLNVLEEEINQGIEQAVESYMVRGADPKAIEKIDMTELRSRVRTTLLNNKVFDFLEKNNMVLSQKGE